MSSRDTLDALKELVDRLSGAASVDDIGHALLHTAKRYGCTEMLILDIGKLRGDVTPAVIFSPQHRPEAVVEQDERQPFRDHPFTLRARASPEPFLMSDVRKAMGLENDERWWPILPDALKGMDGLLVPIYDGEALAWCAAYAGLKPDLSAAAIATLSAATQAAYALYLEFLNPKAKRSRLSQRESDCLNLLAEGKTDAEIGAALGIATRTVRFHLNNAKAKLGVATRIQAVAKRIGRPT